MQEILNIHETAGMLNKSVVYRTFPEVLKDVQEYISKNFASVLRDNPDENRELIESYIGKYLEQSNVGVEGMEQAELCDLLYGEMTGFSFLTRYLYRDDVEEININQWRDVKITYSTGEIIPAKESSCCFFIKTGNSVMARATTSIRQKIPIATSMYPSPLRFRHTSLILLFMSAPPKTFPTLFRVSDNP